MQEIVFIYALIDPTTGEVRYIGKSGNPQQRLTEHLCKPEITADTHKARWLRSLKARNETPVLKVLESVAVEKWQERERTQIAEHLSRGVRLTNLTPGGDGVEKGHKLKPEHVEKIRQALMGKGIGRKHSDAAKEKMRKLRLGKKASAETRKKISQALVGRVWTEDSREKDRLAHLGKKHTQETKDRLRSYNLQHPSRLGARLTEETKQKMRIARLGKKHRQDSIEKMRLAHHGRRWKQESIEKLKITLSRPDVKERMRAAKLGRHPTEATRKKMSLAQKGRRLSTETREKMSRVHQERHAKMREIQEMREKAN